MRHVHIIIDDDGCVAESLASKNLVSLLISNPYRVLAIQHVSVSADAETAMVKFSAAKMFAHI